MSQPEKVNILVLGTPGTGKSTLCEKIVEVAGMTHISVSDLAKSKELFDGYDDEHDCHIIDEDMVLDDMEPTMVSGGVVVEYHSSDFFPERWFALVIVLRTDNTILFDRLQGRGYTPGKISENVEAEIVQVVLDEARASYKAEIVHDVPSNTVEDMDATVDRVTAWLESGQWA